MTTEKRGLFINNGFMALHGVASVMIGTTLPQMIRSFGLSLSQGGFIVSAQSAGGLLILLLGMTLADRVRKPIWIVMSVVAAGLCLAVAGLSPAYWFLVVTFFVTGVIVQILDTLLNAFTGDIAPHGRTRELNLLHMLYGVGAFVGPTFARWLLNQSLQWNAVYWIVGGLYLGCAAVSLVWIRSYVDLDPRRDRPQRVGPDKTAPHVLPGISPGSWTTVALLGGVILFYAAHQVSTTSWLPLYMESSLGVGPGVASATLSFYWVGIIVSRLIASVSGGRIGELRILVWGSVLGGVALIGTVLVSSPVVAVVGFVFAGVATGASIPLVMALAYGHIPGRTGAVTSVVYGLMMIGRLAGPWVTGRIGDSLGLDAGILAAAAVLLIAGAMAGLVAFRSRRTG